MLSYKQGKTTIALCIDILLLFLTCAIIVSINFLEKDTTTKSVSSINVVKSIKNQKDEEESVLVVGLSNDFEEEEEDDSEQNEINTELQVINGENLQNLTSTEIIEEDKIVENIIPNEKDTIQTEITEVIPQVEEEEISEIIQSQNIVPTEYNGYSTIGKIEIPSTGVNIPILSNVTVKGMENAPCLLYQTGDLNKNGNSLIVGHNYRNGTIFSNNKNLNINDKIYVTTLDGNRVEYSVYSKFVTTAEDTTYIKRDTNNKPEITLSSCTDNDELRTIILAKLAS